MKSMGDEESILTESSKHSRRWFLSRVGATTCGGLLTSDGHSLVPSDHSKYETPKKSYRLLTIGSAAGPSIKVIEQPKGYSLGSISYKGQTVETPMQDGFILFVDNATPAESWLLASNCKVQNHDAIRLYGEGRIQGAQVRCCLDLNIPSKSQTISMVYRFVLDRDVRNTKAHLMFFTAFSHRWTCHIYPWAENSKKLSVAPLDYMGIPSVFLYRDDLTLGLFYGIDPRSDYLNPTTWTKAFSLFFEDQKTPVQWHVGSGNFRAGFVYTCPMQIVFSDKRVPSRLIFDLAREWRRVNDYHVEQLHIRSNDEALQLFIGGREKTSMWSADEGYQIQDSPGGRFITMADQGLNAYFDYLVFEMTGQELWRKRAFQQANFLLRAQVGNPSDANYGAFESNYDLSKQVFNSHDRGGNRGLKPDLNMRAAQFLLLLWETVKKHEGTDVSSWYRASVRSVDWVIRRQNPDGGIPQKLESATNVPSRSATPGRALVALPDIVRITKSERYRRFMEDLEKWTNVYNDRKFYFSGAHPDLPPDELEESSIWNIAFYNLLRYEQTGDKTYLEKALGEASLGFTWNCPKQLSWVENPTQFSSSEQKDYVQYCVYNYEDMKSTVLSKLYRHTRDPLYRELFNRVSQNIYFTQVTRGDEMGGMYERIADPWLARTDFSKSQGFNSMGTIYMGQLGVDYFYQIVLLTRMGRSIYHGRNLRTRVFQDRECIYTRDISSLVPAPISILPRRGSVWVEVLDFSPYGYRWKEKMSDPSNAIRHTIWNLRPHTSYCIYANSSLYRRLVADRRGRLSFDYCANSAEVDFELIAEPFERSSPESASNSGLGC
jgi:hypothetical protein